MNTFINNAIGQSEQGRVAVKLFLGVVEDWGLSEEQSLVLAGLNSRAVLHNWRKGVASKEGITVSKDTLERLSYVAGIYKGVQLLFNDPYQWKNWITKPNKHLGGQSALDRMLAGKVADLADVRRYVDVWSAEHYE